MNDGLNRMVSGVFETVGTEVKYGAKMGLVGGAVGVAATLFNDRGLINNVVDTAVSLGRLGVFWGWETAHTEHNTVAEQYGLRTVRWYDWVAANILAYRQEERKSGMNPSRSVEATVIQQLVNPISVSGAKDVIVGAFQATFG